MNLNIPVDKNSAEYQRGLVKTARTGVTVAVAFTVLNILLMVLGSGRYFLFAMTLPYYLTYFGYVFDHFMVSTYTYTGLVLAVVPLLFSVVFLLLSKKDGRWLLGVLAVFGLDTAAMLGLLIWSGDASGAVVDLIFHGWMIICLVRGWRGWQRLQNPEPAPVSLEEEAAPVADLWKAPYDPEMFSETREDEVDTDCPV